jgi:hypothetical protein
MHYAEAFSSEIGDALAENDVADLKALKRMLPQAKEFVVQRPRRSK